MSLADVFVETEALHKARVIGSTWGHLAPKPRNTYSGEILFAHAEYGDITVIRSTIDVDDSPWFFEDIHDFIAGRRKDNESYVRRTKIQPGAVYRFTGTYTKFKNGNFRFSGKIKKVA